MNLNHDFKECVGSLIAHDVKFMIVGGYAVAAHGHPRYTKDLDVWVWAEPSNAGRIMEALADFGFGELGVSSDDFLQPDSVVQLGREPQRIDILTSASGIEFDDAYPRHVLISIDELEVPFISMEDLRVNKLATGRLQDLADAEALKQIVAYELPSGLVLARTTAEFTRESTPAGLRRAHRVATGVWGRLVVSEGEVGFVFEDEPENVIMVGVGGHLVIPPDTPHHVITREGCRFAVEFHTSAVH